MNSLKSKIMLIMSVVIVLPLILLGSLSMLRFKSATTDSVSENLDRLLALTTRLMENEMEKASLVTGILSDNSELIDVANGNVMKNRSAYETLVSTQSNNDASIESIIVTNVSGKALISSDSLQPAIDLSDRAYVQRALSGESAQSAVLRSKTTGESVIAIASPLTSNNRVIGAIVTTVKFSNIANHVRSIQVFDGGYAYLFDRDGLILSHKDAENDFTLNMRDLGIPALDQMVADINAGTPGAADYVYDGVDKYVQYAPVADMGLAITANYDDFLSPVYTIRTFLIVFIFIAVVAALGISYAFTSRSITTPLKKLAALMAEAGKGNLTVKAAFTTGDEIEAIGHAFNAMMGEQLQIVSKVKTASVEVSQGTDDIAHSANDISSATEEIAGAIMDVSDNSKTQNDRVVETSETLLHLSSLIQLAKARAVKTDENVKEALAKAHDGRSSVDITIKAIESIQAVSSETNKHLSALNALSTQITGISSTINAIADQTNMLALNASIEAARAGEHGRGFAVVAEEVRTLAEQTSTEAGGITNVVKEMTNRIEEAVASMKDATDAVASGVEKTQHTDSSFIKIVGAVNEISKDVQKIVEVTDDEVSSSEHILALIEMVATLSDQNTGSSENVASAVEEQTALMETIASSSTQLSTLAAELNQIVDRFIIGGDDFEK